MLSKKKDYIFCFLFRAYIAAVLWITLFSRLGAERRNFLLPFHSYVEICKGEWRPLLENIGNVILFIPLGVALGAVGKWDVKNAGFLASLTIEVLQFSFALGTFECDDLIHNTLGAVIGAWCV
ncbi:MAG: VanZ family protein [Lachnospiraceae bacterium]